MIADSLPLSGIRVLDFGHTVMGPTAGLILADLGAEVIRIEPVTGDPTRRLKGFGTGYFPFFNRNKQSVALNLKDPRGIAIVKRLLAKSDVLIENFGPGTMARLGLDYAQICDEFSRLIYLSLKGFLPGHYETSSLLKNIGVIDAKDMTTESAIAKLMYLLGIGVEKDKFAHYFKQSLRGEITNK